MSTASPPTGYAARGAQNLAVDCLRTKPGERACLLAWRAGDVLPLVSRAIEDTGAAVDVFDLEPMTGEHPASELYVHVSQRLRGAQASVLLASYGLATPLSRAVVLAAERAGTRHLHVVGCDERVLGQSIRASPAVLAAMNARVVERLTAPSNVRVTSPAGTSLEVTLVAQFPLLSATGRPAPGRPENLPTGIVYTHPASVNGTFVADRAVAGEGVQTTPSALRRAPVILRFQRGRVASVECVDAVVRGAVEQTLASHPDADRVGLVVWPTNYLVRSEIGVEVQDALLPGMNVDLGFSLPDLTRARHDAPVQLRLQARRLDVEANGRPMVVRGRFEPALMEGLDPLG